jgi:hypothetical protein
MYTQINYCDYQCFSVIRTIKKFGLGLQLAQQDAQQTGFLSSSSLLHLKTEAESSCQDAVVLKLSHSNDGESIKEQYYMLQANSL